MNYLHHWIFSCHARVMHSCVLNTMFILLLPCSLSCVRTHQVIRTFCLIGVWCVFCFLSSVFPATQIARPYTCVLSSTSFFCRQVSLSSLPDSLVSCASIWYSFFGEMTLDWLKDFIALIRVLSVHCKYTPEFLISWGCKWRKTNTQVTQLLFE